MNVITLEEEAFYQLYYKLAAEIKQQLGAKPHDKWIGGDEAMHMLRIKSKTTLQKLRDKGKIRFTKPEPRTILCDTDSLLDYLDKNAKDTFYHMDEYKLGDADLTDEKVDPIYKKGSNIAIGWSEAIANVLTAW